MYDRPMQAARVLVLAVLFAPAVALAGSDEAVTNWIGHAFSGAANDAEGPPPAFVFDTLTSSDENATLADAIGTVPDGVGVSPRRSTIATSADGKVVWIAADLEGNMACGDESCLKKRGPDEWLRLTAIFDAGSFAKGKEGPAATVLAWHLAKPVVGKADKRMNMDQVTTKIRAGAEDVAKLFAATLPDPKALAATISDRKDVVLFGSDLRERYVGSAAAKRQLLKWRLSFTPSSGIQAGLAAGNTVAWVATLVKATSLAKPKAPAVEYRVFAIYEKTGTAWKIVALHFSLPGI